MPHERDVSDHPGHFSGQLGHRLLVHLLVHVLAVLPGFVQRPLSAKAPISARSAPMMRVEPLGSWSRAARSWLAPPRGQLALALGGGGEHLPGADSKAGGLGGHRMVQQALHDRLAVGPHALLDHAFGLHIGHVPPGAGVFRLEGDLGGGRRMHRGQR